MILEERGTRRADKRIDMAVQTVEIYKGLEKEKQDVERMSAQKKKLFAGAQKSGVLRMTDNDIIKALECCSSENGKDDCLTCPNFKDFVDCKEDLSAIALDLIKRKDEEIERLESEYPCKVKCGNNCEIWAKTLKDYDNLMRDDKVY